MLRALATTLCLVALTGCGGGDIPKAGEVSQSRDAASYLGPPPDGFTYTELTAAEANNLGAVFGRDFKNADEFVGRRVVRADGLTTAVVMALRLPDGRDPAAAEADYVRAVRARNPEAITAGKTPAHLAAATHGTWLVYAHTPDTLLVASSSVPNEAERAAFQWRP
jgi:hypothetical protein